MVISTAVSKLNEILTANGDKVLSIEVKFTGPTGIVQYARGLVNSIGVVQEDGQTMKALVTSDDGAAV